MHTTRALPSSLACEPRRVDPCVNSRSAATAMKQGAGRQKALKNCERRDQGVHGGEPHRTHGSTLVEDAHPQYAACTRAAAFQIARSAKPLRQRVGSAFGPPSIVVVVGTNVWQHRGSKPTARTACECPGAPFPSLSYGHSAVASCVRTPLPSTAPTTTKRKTSRLAMRRPLLRDCRGRCRRSNDHGSNGNLSRKGRLCRPTTPPAPAGGVVGMRE